MTESQQLLAEFVRNGSEEAFKELVSRYVDLVYSAALRLVEGDAGRARDVAQTVFGDLARMAPRLSPNSMLGGWLHRRACFVARTLMRGERRRQARERQAVEMSALENQPDNALEEIAPILDDAIHELGTDDRDVILLRFFEQRSLRSVGDALGTSENVAQKRVARAVQELALLLKQRGYTLPAAALASGLAVAAVKAAPPGLALALAKGALAGSSVAGGLTTASKAVALTKLKVGIAGALVIIGIGTSIWLQQSIHRRQAPAQQPSYSQAAEELAATPEFRPDDGTAVQPGGSERSPVVPQSPASLGAAPSQLTDASPVLASEADATLPMPLSGGALLRRLYSQPGSRLRVEGINLANRHAWQAESSVIEGFVDVNPVALARATRAQVQARAEVSVPIRSLKSVRQDGRPYSDTVDEAWYEALKAASNPEAKAAFYLSALARVGSAATNRGESGFEAKGDLVVAGATNRITVRLRILSLESEKLRISGTTSFSWTSEAVDPFSVMTDEGNFSPDTRVTVKVEWLVGPTNTPLATAREGLVPLYLDLPPASFKTPPRDFQLGPYVEPFPEMPRAPMLVPPGLTNLAHDAKITCSDKNATPQALAKIVDGRKEGADESITYLRKGTQWVQLDLGDTNEIFAIVIWHAHNFVKVYHDVVVQVADDAGFHLNVRTLFNNDQDNSSGLGKGGDREYFETYEGKLIDARGVRGRLLRFYSRGSTESALNEYTELEVYGRPLQ